MFTRPAQHDVYKKAMLQVYSTIKEHQLVNWIMDSTKSNFTMQDQKWSVEQLGLLLHDTPLQKVAMVRGQDPILQIVAESMRKKIYMIFGMQKELQHFATLEEALHYVAPETDNETALLKLRAAMHVS